MAEVVESLVSRALVESGSVDAAAEEYAALARELDGIKPVEPLAAESRRLHDLPEARKGREHERVLNGSFERDLAGLYALRRRMEPDAPDSPTPSNAGAESDGGTEDFAARAALNVRLARSRWPIERSSSSIAN